MKKLSLLFAASFSLITFCFAEVNLSGYLDMSYTDREDSRTGNDRNGSEIGIDEFSLEAKLDQGGPVTGTAVLVYDAVEAVSELDEAFIDYDLGGEAKLTFGHFESTLGYEGKSAPELNQNSRAYDNFANLYDTGIRYSILGLNLALLDGEIDTGNSLNHFTSLGTDTLGSNQNNTFTIGDQGNYVFEASYGFKMNGIRETDKFKGFLGVRYNEGNVDANRSIDIPDSTLYNMYGSYRTNFGESGMTLTLSAEYFYDDRFDPTVYATSVAPERFQRSAIQSDIDNNVLDINDVVVTSTEQFVYDNNPNTEWLDTEQLQNLNQQIDQNNIAIGSGAQQDQISGLLLAANIGYSESAFITVRYSNTKTEFTNANHLGTNQDMNINDPVNLSIAVPDIKVSKWTLAHVSALADDLSLILEVSDEKVSGAYNTTTNTRPDETSLFTAFEILYTF